MNAYCVRGQASFNMFIFILIYTYSMITVNENYQQLLPDINACHEPYIKINSQMNADKHRY